MAKEIKTSIEIQASPEKVWSVLTDFENYPEWNPFIIALRGVVKEGNDIEVMIRPDGGKTMKFRPKVVKVTPYQELRWQGNLFFRGLFDGEHVFEIIDNNNGTVTFIQREYFSGIFSGIFNPEATKRGFEKMNNLIKERAEGRDSFVFVS